jgi:hypothetical protein
MFVILKKHTVMLIRETREEEERPIKGGRMIFEYSKYETPCFAFETAN